MNLNNSGTSSTYKFVLGGERNEYHVSFFLKESKIFMHCTCGHNDNDPCRHCQYVLAGKTSRIIGGDTQLQRELIQKAEKTNNGSWIIRRARKKFAGETHCRRCNSERIVKIKTSLQARIYTIFRECTNHTYFCKDCKWTW